MTKLIIQIPAYNEAETLKTTIDALPKEIEGIDVIETLLIDDGSSDNTSDIALSCGVNHVIKLDRNVGLAKAFLTGIKACVVAGADIIVNTDADNQYDASCIQDIVKPILEKRADIVIGARPIKDIKHFSPIKKFLQKFGSFVVRLLSSTDVEDAPSGFRAMTRYAAENINIYDNFTYTLEMIIQSKAKGLSILSVPIKVNGELRKSRLFKNTFQYVFRSICTMVRMFIVYRPFRFFAFLSSIISLLGVLIGLRFLIFYFGGDGTGHIQSLILSAILLIIGFQTFLLAIIADLMSINRKLLEDIQNKK